MSDAPRPSPTERLRVLADPLANRGTAFTQEDRERMGMSGQLPPRVESIEERVARMLANVRAKPTPIERYTYLASVQNDDETLFFRALIDNLEELLPIVYTPAVGQACLDWSRIWQRPRGLYLTPADRGRIARILRGWPREKVTVIVVTDGGRILGLGDLGANGMGIPIGKLALYAACAGIDPALCLPVALDVGTDTEGVRNDPLYLGLRQPRLAGPAYDALVEEFVQATQDVFPGVLLQFEDFANVNAFRLLARYRDRVCCFNDDIQGTGAMGLAGLIAAQRIAGGRLADQRLLFFGAGEANGGFGAMVVAAMTQHGLSEAEARSRCWFIDSRGLVINGRGDLAEHKRALARDHPPVAGLLEAVEAIRPTALIGASGQPGAFTQPVLEAMAKFNDRPIVFALSNPTIKAECTAEQAYSWTRGRAIFATGSPFAPVVREGRTHATGQANNAFVFPGVGLGVIASGARRVTDEMFFAAAQALAQQVTEDDLALGRIFPPAAKLRAIAMAVAIVVAEVAWQQGLANTPRPADARRFVESRMYAAEYPEIPPVRG